MTELTTEALVDALDCFWNAAIGSAHERQSGSAMDLASVLAEGVAAVAQRLREHAPKQLAAPEIFEPIGYVNRAIIDARGPLPLLHYTPTAHFDTAVYFHPQMYRPPATGIARTEDSVSIPFIADCLRRYADILRNGLIDGAGHYFPIDIDEAAGLLETAFRNQGGITSIEADDVMIEAGEEEIASRAAVGARIYAADIWNAMIRARREGDSAEGDQ